MLSPHPADPTLTTDNLMEVVKEVEHRWWDLGYRLHVPLSKLKSLYQSDHHGMEAVVDYYVRHHPTPSWKQVARALQLMDLDEQAQLVTTRYVKGTDVIHVSFSPKQFFSHDVTLTKWQLQAANYSC